jgi:hypothetical protein
MRLKLNTCGAWMLLPFPAAILCVFLFGVGCCGDIPPAFEVCLIAGVYSSFLGILLIGIHYALALDEWIHNRRPRS